MRRLIVVGARGHARAVLDVVRAEERYHVVGLIDSFQPAGTATLGYRVLGGEEQQPAICRQMDVDMLFVAIGDNFQRAAMTQRIRNRMPDAQFATCIHPSVVLGADVEIGSGTVVMPGSVVVGGCSIGEGCIVNTSCSLDHDSVMADWSSLAPGVVAGGYLRLGRRSSIGVGAIVAHRITIGEDAVVGAGALVLQDIPRGVVAYGSPCHRVRERNADEPYL